MPTRVTAAVIPVAGLGTRFLPATKAVPKEMLPIVDKPTLQYIVEEAHDAGITQIVLVQGRYKGAIEDHFDASYELEDTLEKRNKTAELALVREVPWRKPHGMSIVSVRQKAPLGLGHAVLCAQPVIGDAPFAVLLGDDLVRTEAGQKSGIAQLIDAFSSTGKGQVALMTVAMSEIHKYGAAEIDAKDNVLALVEKPAKGTEKPGHKAIIGRYCFPASIWAHLEKTKPGKGGEIQLTDAMDTLRAQEGLMGCNFKGRRVDAGDKLGYLEANLLEALSRADLREGTLALLKDVLASAGTK
ncbi:MAG TPA: UTP--glucose-1-phosphate uridylyltransferase [Myxococcota bacterium]